MDALPFSLETDLERQIAADPDWQQGAAWGEPRPGHAEGKVAFHIADVLVNIERQAADPDERRTLRLIALLHDSFKYRVDQTKPRVGENHHGMIARRFAERFITDPVALDVIELHDEAYNSWSAGARKDDWPKAEARAHRLLDRLGASLPLYLHFYQVDNQTGGKDQTPLVWFEGLIAARTAI